MARHFLDDMGARPSAIHQLERKDNDGPYCPENCEWVLPEVQAENKSTNVKITYLKVTLTVSEWARRTGMSPNTIRHRHKRGWSADRIFTTPLGHGGRPSLSNDEPVLGRHACPRHMSPRLQ